MAALASRSSFFGAQTTSSSAFGPRRVCSVLPVVRAAYGDLPKFKPGKKWVRQELTKNGKPLRVRMHIKSGDTVQVVTGSDKGKVATIKSVCSKTGKIIVEGVNIKTNTVAPMKEGETGKLEQKEYPIHHSNVMLYSTTQNVRSRVGHKEVDGKKVRYLVKTGEVLN